MELHMSPYVPPSHPCHTMDLVEYVWMAIVHADMGRCVHDTLDNGAECELCSGSKHPQSSGLVRKDPVGHGKMAECSFRWSDGPSLL